MNTTRRILLATAAATPLATPAIAAPVDPVIPLCEEYFRRAKWLQSGNHGLDDEQFEAECDA